MRSPAQKPQHSLCLAFVARLSEDVAVDDDDRIGGDDQCVASGTATASAFSLASRSASPGVSPRHCLIDICRANDVLHSRSA